MDRNFFDGIVHFLAVAEAGSFTAAARKLDVSPTAVSKAIRVLEVRHGTKLFQRTTRSVALTEAGATLFARLGKARAEVDEALKDLASAQAVPAGTLRLTMPRSIMPALIEPHLAQFQTRCPMVRLDISLNDRPVNLVAEGFDAGIRLGEAIDKDMIAVRLTGEVRWAIAASPAYWDREGRPESLDGLAGRRAILYRFPGSRSLHIWEFVRNGKTVQVGMETGLVVDDRAAIVRMAVRGLGPCFVQEMEVAQEVARGDLELMFKDHIPPDDGVFLYFPASMQSQPKLRVFIDAMRKRSGDLP
jgi:DNA-binding transcriptional LysR family regulator|tara:strand:+ start:2887 stop:3792 length:906 start_codon:yes stop_codon:yes gene_type:complete